MEKIEQLLEDYRIALLEWNDAIQKNKEKTTKYNDQKQALENLQDFIINQSGDIRHFKRSGEI